MCQIKNPCKYCTDHSPTCHTVCKDYARYKAEVDARAETIRKAKLKDAVAINPKTIKSDWRTSQV